MKTKPKLSVAALSFALSPDSGEIQLFPAGPRFRGVDGRPAEVPAGWTINSSIAARLIQKLQTRTNPLVVDYEHQTLAAAKNGQPAPAAGWLEPKSLVWREGEGLFAKVEWTAPAREMIAANEYKFISPVFPYDPKTGEVRGLLHAALTNNPALDGMADVTALAAASYAAQLSEETPSMEKLLELLRVSLGLPADADDAAITAALTQTLGAHTNFAALTAAVAERDNRIAALSASQYDPAKFVPLSTVVDANNQIAALTQQLENQERTGLMTAALSDGRILPYMEAWAKSLSLTALKSYLDTAKPLASLSQTQTDGAAPTGGPGVELDETMLAVCSMFGNDPEQVKKTAQAQTNSEKQA